MTAGTELYVALYNPEVKFMHEPAITAAHSVAPADGLNPLVIDGLLVFHPYACSTTTHVRVPTLPSNGSTNLPTL